MSSTTTATLAPARPPLLTRNKVGLALLGLLGVGDLFSLVGPGMDPDQVGPPDAILLIDTVLGVITVVAVVVAFVTHRRGAVRIAAGSRILSALTAVPAFFAGVPAWLVVLVSVIVLLTITGVVLALAQPRRTAPVTD